MKKIIFSCAILCSTILSAKSHLVSFDASMKRSSTFNVNYSYKNPAWIHFRDLYEKYKAKQNLINLSYKIPKIIHFIWIGSPVPERCKKLFVTWRKYHPTWTIRIWTDADIEPFKMQNKRAFDAAKNWGEKADIWRYEILLRFGGLYSDTDFECLKAFDDLHKSCTFFAGIAYGKVALLYNGLIGCTPNHPIIQRCIEGIRPGIGDQNSERIMQETGPLFFSRAFFSVPDDQKDGAVGFPITYFYSFPNTLRGQNIPECDLKKKWTEKESYAIHYWATSWVVKK